MGFSFQETTLIKKLFEDGASDNMIALELSAQSGRTIRVSPKAIADERRRLDIRPAREILREKGEATPAVQSGSQMETAAVITVARLRKPRKRIAPVFNDAAAGKAAPVAVVAEERPDEKPVILPMPAFRPVMADAANVEKGRFYILPGQSVLHCLEIQDVPIAGQSVKMATFEELHRNNPALLRFGLASLAEKKIRLAASPDYLKRMLAALKAGHGSVNIPNKPVQQQRFFQDLEASSDMSKLAVVMRHSYAKKDASLGVEFSNRIAHVIASEYAAVLKIDYDKAKRLVEDAAGKPHQKRSHTAAVVFADAPRKENH